MCDPNIRDIQRGEQRKKELKEDPRGPRVIRQLHTNLKN